MASAVLEQITKNIFDENITESISAADLQFFTSAIFQASESIIRKFKTPAEVDYFRDSNPDIPIYNTDLVVLTDEYPGLYRTPVDSPFFRDLIIVAETEQIESLPDLADVKITNPVKGQMLMFDGAQWINQPSLTGSIDERPEYPTQGMMYFDNTVRLPIWWDRFEWIDASGKTR